MRRMAIRGPAPSSITSSHGSARSARMHKSSSRVVAGAVDGRLQRHPYQRGCLQARTLGEGRLFAPEAREKYRELVVQGWTDTSAISCRTSGSTPSGTIGGIRSSATPEFALTMRCLVRALRRDSNPPGSTARREAGRRPAITRRSGLNSRFDCSCFADQPFANSDPDEHQSVHEPCNSPPPPPPAPAPERGG